MDFSSGCVDLTDTHISGFDIRYETSLEKQFTIHVDSYLIDQCYSLHLHSQVLY